jgi:pimeloyl-ACP methyl ester carboxylesterase
LFVLLAAPAAAQSGAAEPTTPHIVDAQGQPLRSAITSLEPAMVGGVKQWLLIRGHDIWNPVLLCLDSAPGVSQMAWSRRYNAELEKHFVVVNWDQRGAGKSFTGKSLNGQGTVDQLVNDVLEVAGQLRTRFRQEKIYLLGHGYGAMIGTLAAQRHPELFHALVAVAPVVNPPEADQAAYRYALDTATQLSDAATIEQLTAIGPPPYTGKGFYARYGAVRAAALRLAGAAYPSNAFRETMSKAIAEAPEYSQAERQRLAQAQSETFTDVYPALARIDLAREAPAVAVPMYFVLGRHDHAAGSHAAEKYFEALRAPMKSLVWFEQSAQAPNYEEPDKFLQMMVGTVLTDTLQRREITH